MKCEHNFFRSFCLSSIFLLGIFSGISYATEPTLPALSPNLPAKPGTGLITPEKLLQIAYLDLNNDPFIKWVDNKHFIYRFPSLSPTQGAQINLYGIELKQSEFLTEGEGPIPSPDGKWLAFVKKDAEVKQLWIINIQTKEMKQISTLEGGLTGYYQYHYEYIWSSDSKKIVLSHQDYVGYWENKPRPLSHIELIDITTLQSKIIAKIDATVNYFSMMPTNEILFVKERIGRFYNDSVDRVSVEALHVESGKSRTLIKFEGLQQLLHPQLSNDGKNISLMYDAENPLFTFMISLGIISSNADIETNPVPIKRITYDLQLAHPHWSFDNKSIVVLRCYGAYGQLYRIDLSTGKSIQLTNGALNIRRYDLSPDGNHIAWMGEDAHGKSILRLAGRDASQVEDLLTQSSVPANTALSEVREIEWKTDDYPAPMRGLLVMPLNYQQGISYPLVVDIHGGGEGEPLNAVLQGGILSATPLEWQMWAAKGYAVFVPEFRSSGAFGSLAISRDLLQNHDALGGDLKDIETGVTYLIENGIANPNQLAIFGHSAGGLRANWFAVATHRYKAIVSHDGWADEVEPALNNPPSQLQNYMYGGTPQEVPENYLKNSPLNFVSNVTTPILFLMGNSEVGGIDYYHTVFKFFNEIKNKGIETDYIEFSDEGHAIEKLENRKDALDRITGWIERHCSITPDAQEHPH